MAVRLKHTGLKFIVSLSVAAFWIFLWYLAASEVDKALLLPSPADVGKRLWQLLSESVFYKTMGLSLFRVGFGIFLAVLSGVILAVLTARSRIASAVFSPLITVIKSTPVASFAIIAVFWLGRARLPIFVTLLIVLPVVWANVETGLRQVDKGLLEMAKVYRVGAAKRIFGIFIPSVAPYFSSAFKTSFGLAFKAGISAEVIVNTPSSVGQKLFEAKSYLQTVDLFAWTAAVVILNLVLDAIIGYVTKLGKAESKEEAGTND